MKLEKLRNRKNRTINSLSKRFSVILCHIVIRIAIVLLVLLFIRAVFSAVYTQAVVDRIVLKLVDETERGIFSSQAYIEQIVSIGIAVISLAVAVWAGLNISNSIERKELDDLRTKTDSIKKFVSNVDKIDSISFELFMMTLANSIVKSEEGTKYFYEQFSSIGRNERENYYVLARIECLFKEVKDLHNTVDHIDQELSQLAEQGIALIEGYQTNDRLVNSFVQFRYAEFLYYGGYVQEDLQKRYESFKKAIDIFFATSQRMKIHLPKYKDDKTNIPKISKEICKLPIYMANSIGDCCRKIYERKPEPKKEESADTNVEGEEIPWKYYGKMGLFYCKCAVEWANNFSLEEIRRDDLQYFEVYYRNYGVAHEIYDRKFEAKFKHADTILDHYLCAYYCTIKDTNLPNQRIQSVYHTLLSYLNAYWKDKFGIKENKKGEITEIVVHSTMYESINNEDVEKLRKMVAISELGMLDMPRNNLPVVMNGFAYGYVIILIGANNKDTIKNFPEHPSVYYKSIKNVLSRLELMNVDDRYSKQLKAIYEKLANLVSEEPKAQN